MSRFAICILCIAVAGIPLSVLAYYHKAPMDGKSLSALLPMVIEWGSGLGTLWSLRGYSGTDIYGLWSSQPSDDGGGSSKQGSNDQSKNPSTNGGSSSPTTSSNSGSSSFRAYLGAVGGKGGGDDDPEEDRPVDYNKRLSTCNDTPGFLEAQPDHHSDSSRVTLVHGLIPPLKQPHSVDELRNDPSDQTLSREFFTPYPTESSKRFPPLLPLSEENPSNTSGCDRNVSALPLSLAPPTDLSSTQDEFEENVPVAEQEHEISLSVEMQTVCTPSSTACVMPECMRHPQSRHIVHDMQLLNYPPDTTDWEVTGKKKRKYIPVNMETVNTDGLVGLSVEEATDMIAGELQTAGFDPEDEFALAQVIDLGDHNIYIPLKAGTVISDEIGLAAAVHVSKLVKNVGNSYIRKIRHT